MNATLTRNEIKATPETLTIKGATYGVESYTPEAPGYRNGVRLSKADGTTYDVVDGPFGAECDCPDWQCRHDSHQTAGCKHVRACRDAGLIASPDPTARKVEPARTSIPGVTRVADEFDEPAPAPAPKADPALARRQAAAFGIKVPADAYTAPTPKPAEKAPQTPATAPERRVDVQTGRMLYRTPTGGWASSLPVPGEPWNPDISIPPARPSRDETPDPEPTPCCGDGEFQPCSACVAEAASPEPEPAVEPAPLVEGEDGRRSDAGEDLGWADPASEWEDDEDADDFGPAGGWPEWTDGDVWNLGPDPDERLTLGELVAREIGRFRRMESGAGDVMAEALAELLTEVELTHAPDAETLRDRRAALTTRW